MKKLAVLVMATLLAVMFVAPSFAGDMLKLSGEYRVRGWDKSNPSYIDDPSTDVSYFDQRMRVQAKVTASDNAYVVIRADMGEGVWGTDLDGNIARPTYGSGKDIHFDRLYGVFSQEYWELTAGLQYYSLGISEVVDSQPVGLKLLIKTDVVQPSLMFAKISENGSSNDDGDFDDANLYGLNVNFKAGSVDAKVFGAYMDDNGVADDTKYTMGAYASAALGALNLSGELAYLAGDDGATEDYKGTQFYFKADGNVSEKVKLGGEFLFALGTDGANETQISHIDSDWESFAPIGMDTAPDTDLIVLGGHAFDLADSSAALAGENGAGIIGLTLFVDASVMEDLSIGAKGGYFMPEEDASTDLDSLAALNLWGQYNLGSNTKFILAYLYATPDYDTFAGGEDASTIYAKFAVKF